MSAMWTVKRGRVMTASFGVLSAWACTVANKSDYTFTDTPGTGGSSSAGKGTGGATAGKGGTSGEAGVMETGGTSGLGGRGGRGGRSSLGGRGGKAGEAGQAGQAGEAGAAAAGGSSGTGGNAGEAGESGAAGEAGMTSTGTCGDGHVDSGEQCDLGTNNGVTACGYGLKSCTVCTKQCTRAAGTATYCGDGKRQASHEQCDDGNTVTEGCPTYDDTTCNTCDANCQTSKARVCGDGVVNGDALTSIKLEYVGLWANTCSATKTMPFYLNGIPIQNAPQSACSCTTTVSSLTITDTAVLAAVRPKANDFEVRIDGTTDITYVNWVRVTFTYQDGSTLVVKPIDDGQADTNGVDLCTTPQPGPKLGAPFDVPRVEACDGDSGCVSCGYADAVPSFAGDHGPSFAGWTECVGYLDTTAGDDIPTTGWATACKVPNYNTIRVACGPNPQTYRYIDVSKNVLRDGTVAYPDMGLITGTGDQNGTAFTVTVNDIYATVGTPVDSETSWWGTASGCAETDNGLYINPTSSCSWEVTNCFGQSLTGDRHLWVYMK